MKLFREDNTEGYTQEQLNALNEEWEERAQDLELEEYTEEYDQEASWFADKVAKRFD